MADRDYMGNPKEIYPPTQKIDLTSKPKIEETPTEGTISLSELEQGATTVKENPTGFNPNAVQSFDPSTIIPKKPKKEEDTVSNSVFNALDLAVERTKTEISEFHRELEAAMYEDYIAKQDEQDEDEMSSTKTIHREEKDPIDNYDDDMDSDDIPDPDDEIIEDIPVKRIITTKQPVEEEEIPVPSTPKKVIVSKPVEEEEVHAPSSVKIRRTVDSNFVYDDKEFESDFEEEESRTPNKTEEEETEQLIEDLKKATKPILKNSMTRLDLSQFRIADKPVKASSVILKDDVKQTADWVLYESGYPVSVTGLSGPELIKLDPNNSTRNRLNTLKDIYKIIYDHIVDENKPSFEKWLKQTKYNDLDHIYFALYMATFGKNNFVSYRCPNKDCEETFLKSIPFEDFVKYKDDNVKNRVKEIMEQSTDVGTVEYTVELVQASDKYAFAMRTPSLYNVVMENAGISNAILEKYSDLIDTINYIDCAYEIDMVNKTLNPISIPVVKNDPVKSAVKKIKTFYSILKQLSSDEYYAIRAYINKVDKQAEDITYFIPEAVCPECGKKIPAETEMNANGLLFTRHHLGAFASM